jgi:molybdopterin/thiamine biosynthesis adenylyltransferase
MEQVLIEADSRFDVDTVFDVHTHPFSESNAWFSGGDDNDESTFAHYLYNTAPELNYGSIVFTRSAYKARIWDVDRGRACHYPALIKTQKPSERVPSPDDSSSGEDLVTNDINGMFHRSVLALGLENMRLIANNQRITIAGVGGIGSIIGEHLIHMGFSQINLIDFDTLELSNLNRIVGATYKDARGKRLKVEAIKESLEKINPKACVSAYPISVFDESARHVFANSDWIIIATDNHASRYRIQELAFEYYVPFITAGVNITVDEGQIVDMSGEVILVRMGDNICLTCLKRLSYNEIAKDLHPDGAVRNGLVQKGYVSGHGVKEPAVKTLNTHIATMAVDTLVNQYTERCADVPILVYEDNGFPMIYEDKASLRNKNAECIICGM